MGSADEKHLEWMFSAKKDLRSMPQEVGHAFGYALNLVQNGDTPRNAKPLRGFGGTSVMEIAEDFETDTYRAIYTARFEKAVYVLHRFQKKAGAVRKLRNPTWS